MNYYKPYSYLYKRVVKPSKLKSCFVSWIPKSKTLDFVRLTTSNDKTTIIYSVVPDLNQLADHMEEFEHEIDWNSNPHEVENVIGSGSGVNGGSATINSNTAELY
ncbi:MAG: hypothetical protein R2764_03265 [Bacteroidales bacterium]